MADIVTLTVGQMAAHCYLVSDPATMDAIVIDPGDDAEYISDTITRLRIRPVMIVATHGHFDHIMAAFVLTHMYAVPFAIHQQDAFLVARMAETAAHFLGISGIDPAPVIDVALDGLSHITVGHATLDIIPAPGHTPGSICIYDKDSGTMMTGDTIFADGGVGRTDHSYGSPESLRASIRRILTYPSSTRLLPGHGEETSVGVEAGFHVQ